MTFAYVLMNIEVGKEIEVVNALRKIQYVKKASRAYGMYDVVAEIETPETESNTLLKDTLTNHIRRLNDVGSTVTIIVLSPEEEAQQNSRKSNNYNRKS